MLRGEATAMVGTGDGVRVPASGRASRGLPRLLGASMVKEEGTGAGREVGQLGQRGQRPRRSAGRGCRRAAVGTRRARAERSVSDGKARRVLEWCRDGAAQRGSSAVAAGAASTACSGACSARAEREKESEGEREERESKGGKVNCLT